MYADFELASFVLKAKVFIFHVPQPYSCAHILLPMHLLSTDHALDLGGQLIANQLIYGWMHAFIYLPAS
jgi:hypothetical protein